MFEKPRKGFEKNTLTPENVMRIEGKIAKARKFGSKKAIERAFKRRQQKG